MNYIFKTRLNSACDTAVLAVTSLLPPWSAIHTDVFDLKNDFINKEM